MSTISRIVSIILSGFLLVLIFELVRRKKLKEKYALLWLCIGLSIFICSVATPLLFFLTRLLGIQLPVNMVFFLGLVFLVAMNLHFSLVISKLTDQYKKVIQKLALLENENKIADKGK